MSVADLDRSVGWYGDKLGLKLLAVTTKNRDQRVACMQGPGFILEMIWNPSSQPLPVYRSHPEDDNPVQGHKHFGVRVENGAQTEKELRVLDVPIVFVPVIGETYGIFIKDPTGNVMEVLQETTPKGPADPDRVPEQMPIELLGPSHTAISVPDVESSTEWYMEKLGFEFMHTTAVPRSDKAPFTITWLKGPGFCVELFGVPESRPLPPERCDPVTDLETLGNKYFSLKVNDLEAAEEKLKELKVDIVPNESATDDCSLFIRDNAGNLIELLENESN